MSTIIAKRNGAMENEKIAFEASFNSFNVVYFGVPEHPTAMPLCLNLTQAGVPRISSARS